MTHQPLLLSSLSLVTLLALPACSNQSGSVDVGRNLGSQLADYAAGWDGYAEAFVFDDGSDHVRITLDAAGQGTLVVGDQAPPPPLSLPLPLDDPNFDISTYPLGPGMLPGLPYSIGESHIQERRIQLSVNLNERLQQVCATQTPICEGDSCSCIPYYSGMVWACRSGTTCTTQDPVTGAVVEVSRNKFFLCGGQAACGCDSTGCYASEYNALLDAALEDNGARLVGTLLAPGRVTLRMTRD